MQRIRDLLLYAEVVIKTVNVVISRCCFAEEDTDLFISEGGKGGVMIPFHAQILTKFTRHVQF